MQRLLWLLTLLPGLALADTIYLEGGRTINGVIVERTERTLVIEIGPGRVGIPLARVVKVVPSSSPLAEYRKRVQELQGGDVPGWLRLADWAERNDLRTQAQEACEQVLRLEPANSTARRCLGEVLQNGQWMSFEDGQRARGLVQYGSQWVTATEHQRLVASETESSLVRKAQAEADARVREAEARAREAEARAQAVEHDAQNDGSGGLYLPPFGGGAYICRGGCGPGCGVDCGTHRPPAPAPRPAPANAQSRPPTAGMTSGSQAPAPSPHVGRGKAQASRPRN